MSTSNDPLWLVMQEAADNAAESAVMNFDGFAIAAKIRALADWLVPEEILPPIEEESLIDHVMYAVVNQRQRIRQRLLAEAERAEAGR